MGNEKRKMKKNFQKGANKIQQTDSIPSKRKFRTKEKEGFILQKGEVIQSVGNGFFKILTENGIEILSNLSGKMRQNCVKILVGDKVEVQISVYDLTKGRITRRI